MAETMTAKGAGRYGTAGEKNTASGDEERLLLQREGSVDGVDGQQPVGNRGEGVGITSNPNVRSGMRYAMFAIVVVGCVFAAHIGHVYATYWTQAEMQVRNSSPHATLLPGARYLNVTVWYITYVSLGFFFQVLLFPPLPS